MKPLKIYKREAFLIKLDDLDTDQVKMAEEMYTFRFYDEKACSRCELLPERHSETCDACAAFKAPAIQLAKTISSGDTDLLSLPIGNRKKMRVFLKRIGYADNYEVISKHPKPRPFTRPISITGKLRSYQVEAVLHAIKKKRGVIRAPARSGKTLMGAGVVCKLQVKTLIIAHQREWLVNFQETFLGSETQQRFTDARRRQVRFCRTYDDFVNTDVCLATPQQFMSKGGQKLLQRIKNLFGVMIFDEVHQAAALQTSRVVSQINAEYKLGLTATNDRKDQKYTITENLIGDVVYDAQVERLRLRTEVMHTGLTFEMKNRDPNAFTFFVNRIESNRERRNLIIAKALKMAKQGHLVLIPLARVASVLSYTKAINEEAERRIACAFHGGVKNRKELLTDIRNYKYRIVVGMISLISTGINIPRASAIIECTPTSNIPKCQQRLSRVLTPYEDKPDPVVVFVLDESEAMRSMRRNEFWNCVKPQFDPLIDRITYKQLTDWFANRQTSSLPSLKEIFG